MLVRLQFRWLIAYIVSLETGFVVMIFLHNRSLTKSQVPGVLSAFASCSSSDQPSVECFRVLSGLRCGVHGKNQKAKTILPIYYIHII